jgi:hypothetical protein
MAKRGARVTIEDLEDKFRLGELIDSYPLNTVAATFVQIILGIIAIVYVTLAVIEGGLEVAHGSTVTASLLFASLPNGLALVWVLVVNGAFS